jgi:Tol biopolymer transport system component/tRNA A-37 threonylcarbamoyl transferase component Bud32
MTTPVDRLSSALLGHYQIEREIGQGGMATVYLAQDLRHQRKVALKVLRPELSAILGGERFLHEIRTTANLQHPHIVPLHDSGESEGIVYYVMPYIEGESLRARLTREKQLPVDESVRIAREVADALDYAHRRGVVHRDIKPENILLHDGRAQVADFGIALAVSTAGGGTRMTETGMSLGTPHYMSPEQAMGERDISAKSDIYALGCVLYEMLAGEPPFTGPTAQAIIARVVTEEPRSLVVQRRSVSPQLEAVVRKALEKLPADRFSSAAQFAAALANPESVALPTATHAAAVPGRPRRTMRTRLRSPAFAIVGLLALLVLATGAAAWGWLREEPVSPAPVGRFTLEVPPGARFIDGPAAGLAMSPDGSRIVYVGVDERGQRHLFMRSLDELAPSPIPGTRDGSQPFFSPDGRSLAFATPGRLLKISLAGGPALAVATLDSGFFGGTWGVGGVIVFGMDAGLRQVPAAGGRPVELTLPDTSREIGHALPHFLPDGNNVLFQVRGSDNVTRIAAVDVRSRAVKRFDVVGANPRYVSSGHVVLPNIDGSVTAAPFDPERVEFTGAGFPVAEGVLVGPGGGAELGVSLTGNFVYATGQSGVRSIVLVDRRGVVQPLSTELRAYGSPRVSPDGSRIAVDIQDGASSGIWIFDITQKTLTRLTFEREDARPFWTPDGTRVTYTRAAQTTPDVAWIRADGSALAESLLVTPGRQLGDAWSPDGRTLIYHQNTAALTRNDIMIMSLDSARTPRPYLQTRSDEFTPVVSPDGRWLAYASDESGRVEIYVRAFPEPGAKIQVSLDGGVQPQWSTNGRELFYRNGDRMMSASVQTQPSFTVAQRTELFTGSFVSFQFHTQYDVTRDGRFIMLQGPQASSDLVVVLNWFDQLRAQRGAAQTAPGSH